MTTDISLHLAAYAATQICFLALWAISLVSRDSSIVDFWWGPGFFAQMVVVVALDDADPTARDALLLGLVGLWSLRLGWVLGRRRIAEGHEDPRYQALRAAWEPGFWWKSLFLVFILQAIVQAIVAIGPIAGLLAAPVPLGGVAVLGALTALGGLALETRADHELDQFKRDGARLGLCETGLRAHVRHPNYLGEIIFWSGIALIAVEAGAWAGLVAPVMIALFLVRVSGAPMLDERLAQTRPGYAAYRARVPAFLPRLGAPRLSGRDPHQ